MDKDIGSPLPIIQNNEFKQIYPVYIHDRGDNTEQFAMKYNEETKNIYELLTKLATNNVDDDNVLANMMKIDNNKLYIRNKENTDWIFIFDIENPEFGNNEEISNRIDEILEGVDKAISASKEAEEFLIDTRIASSKVMIRTYPTCEQMKLDDSLKLNMSVLTQGYEEFNDGKGGFYVIKNEATEDIDDYNVIKIKEDLYAIRIIPLEKYLSLSGGTVSGNINAKGYSVIADDFIGNLQGKADSADKAIQDGNGNEISAIYISGITFNKGKVTVTKGNDIESFFKIDEFESSPLVPTPDSGDNSKKVANTEFVVKLFNDIVNSGITNSNLSENGYFEFGNGLCIQFANYTTERHVYPTKQETINFPKAFGNKCLFVLPVAISNTISEITNKSKTGFEVTLLGESYINQINYIAIGLNQGE